MCLAHTKPYVPPQQSIKTDVVVHAIIPALVSRKTKLQDQPSVEIEFEASLGYRTRKGTEKGRREG